MRATAYVRAVTGLEPTATFLEPSPSESTSCDVDVRVDGQAALAFVSFNGVDDRLAISGNKDLGAGTSTWGDVGYSIPNPAHQPFIEAIPGPVSAPRGPKIQRDPLGTGTGPTATAFWIQPNTGGVSANVSEAFYVVSPDALNAFSVPPSSLGGPIATGFEVAALRYEQNDAGHGFLARLERNMSLANQVISVNYVDPDGNVSPSEIVCPSATQSSTGEFDLRVKNDAPVAWFSCENDPDITVSGDEELVWGAVDAMGNVTDFSDPGDAGQQRVITSPTGAGVNGVIALSNSNDAFFAVTFQGTPYVGMLPVGTKIASIDAALADDGTLYVLTSAAGAGAGSEDVWLDILKWDQNLFTTQFSRRIAESSAVSADVSIDVSKRGDAVFAATVENAIVDGAVFSGVVIGAYHAP